MPARAPGSSPPGAVVTVTHNRTTGRFHPFVWVSAPLPGGAMPPPAAADARTENRHPWRYRSTMHHTEGFADVAGAEAYATTLVPLMEERFGTTELWSGVDEDAWEPDVVPARMIFV